MNLKHKQKTKTTKNNLNEIEVRGRYIISISINHFYSFNHLNQPSSIWSLFSKTAWAPVRLIASNTLEMSKYDSKDGAGPRWYAYILCCLLLRSSIHLVIVSTQKATSSNPIKKNKKPHLPSWHVSPSHLGQNTLPPILSPWIWRN